MAYINMEEIANRAISDLDAIKAITNIAEQIIASKDEEIAKLNKKIIKLENKKIRLKNKYRSLQNEYNSKLHEYDDKKQSTEYSDDTDADDIDSAEAEIWY